MDISWDGGCAEFFAANGFSFESLMDCVGRRAGRERHGAPTFK